MILNLNTKSLKLFENQAIMELTNKEDARILGVKKKNQILYFFLNLITLIASGSIFVFYLIAADGNNVATFFISGTILILSLIVFATITQVIQDKAERFEKARETFSDEEIKPIMQKIMTEKYLPSNDIALFAMLYHNNRLREEQKEKLDSFLANKNKKIENYLYSLEYRELKFLTEPYRKEIKAQLDNLFKSYFIEKEKLKKDEEMLRELAELNKRDAEYQFQQDCKKFFYSNLSKNVAAAR